MTTHAAKPLLDGHWSSEVGGEGQVVFTAEGIHCDSCARSIRLALATLPGVHDSEVNIASGRVSVSWDTTRNSLGDILGRVAAAGYRPVPLVGEAAVQAQRDERRASIKRIGLAGLGSMLLMMYAVGLHAGAFQGMDPKLAGYLNWTSLLITTPVLFLAGAPILRGGLADLRRGTLGMDVTVSIALLLAYVASIVDTARGSGEAYFDSVTMFIFFLLLGRHVEMRSRHQAASVTDALARSLPARVQRIDPATGAAERIPLAEVRAGDRLRVAGGEVVPVDGEVLDAAALVDESLVTGESQPRTRAPGETLLGGSTNAGVALTMRATRRADESTLHGLVRMLERAQGERPRLGLAAERMASWFVLRVLLITAVVGVAWAVIDPSRLLPAVLAVLVATCPCALSLATPVAIAAATSHLARLGVLVMRGDAVEGLATIDTVMLDKTGTLTVGRPTVTRTRIVAADGPPMTPVSPGRALAVAAALEQGSRHPIALAFAPFHDTAFDCADARESPGEGIEGHVDGRRWRIGKAGFALAVRASSAAPATSSDAGIEITGLSSAAAVLAGEDGEVVMFDIEDALRPDAAGTVDALRRAGLTVQITSGDRPEVVARVAASLGLASASGALRPEDKLERLRVAQRAGHRVLMVGDGINDGPVLAAADVSMAMGRGSAVAHAAGDLLLMRDSLSALPAAVAVARRALALVRQNLRWAAAYNLTAIPIAALGLMPPWVAALGMSASSLVVVFNARRLLREGDRDGASAASGTVGGATTSVSAVSRPPRE